MRWPYSQTARITVAQPTPRSTATRATSVASSPTRRAHSARARSVSTARGRIAGARSDQVRRPHVGSAHRQTRLNHTSVTGRPPAGRSRTQRGLRSCRVATTPQLGQPVTDSVVSISNSSSPPYSAAASTTKPGKHAQWRRAGKAAYPYRVDSVDDAGVLVSGFLASYLLPFLASPKPSVSDLGAYTVFSSSPSSLPSTLISHTSTRRCIYLTVRLSASQRRVPQ